MYAIGVHASMAHLFQFGTAAGPSARSGPPATPAGYAPRFHCTPFGKASPCACAVADDDSGAPESLRNPAKAAPF